MCAWVTINKPAVAEALAREAFDAVVLDMQHGADRLRWRYAFNPKRGACGQTDHRSHPDRRICLGEPTHGLRRLRYPCADDRQRRRCPALVEAVKFPPLGERSWGPRAALPLSGLDASAYLRAANGMTQAIAMIETRAALDALDDILGVEGLDGVYVGPLGSFHRLEQRR